MVRTLEEAAAFVDEVGLALLLPKTDVVLPSLWEQVNGSPERSWAVRRPDGTFERWSEEMSFLWGAKDELPAAGLVCVGKHLARVSRASPRGSCRSSSQPTARSRRARHCWWPRRCVTPAR